VDNLNAFHWEHSLDAINIGLLNTIQLGLLFSLKVGSQNNIIIQWTESSNLWIALWGLLVRLMQLALMWVYCEFVTARQELYGERAKSGSFIKKTKVEHISPHNIWKTDETNRNLPVSNTKQVASQIQHQPRKENEWSNSLMKHEKTPICYD